MGGETPAMAQPPIGANFNQAANVLIHFSPQITFSGVFPVHQLPDTVHLGVAELTHPGRNQRVNVGLRQYF
jgi:hypothetical protein